MECFPTVLRPCCPSIATEAQSPRVQTQALTYQLPPPKPGVFVNMVYKLNQNPPGHIILLSAFTLNSLFTSFNAIYFFYKFNGRTEFHYIGYVLFIFKWLLRIQTSKREIKLAVKYSNSTKE